MPSFFTRRKQNAVKEEDDEGSVELPAMENPNIPSVARAIEFGKSNRPHRLPAPAQKSKHRLARPGEDVCEDGNALPYHPWRNGVRDLDEFGIGVSLYFRQLLFLTLILTMCAGIYVYTVMYNIEEVNVRDDFQETPYMLRGSIFGTIRDDLSLMEYGYQDLGVVVLLLICLGVAKKMQDVTAESIDESQQTPQDYTVRIMNPPKTIVDPDTYYNQFKDYGEIVFVTVCLDNGILMKKLTEKYVIEHRLEASMAGNDALDDPRLTDELQSSLPFWKRFFQQFGFFQTRESIHRKLREVKEEIHGLTMRQYTPVRVYITFDTEEGQRRCLTACNGVFHEDAENMVAGQKVRIKEAEEPSTVIWENLHISKVIRGFRLIISLSISTAILIISSLIINYLFATKTAFTALFIAAVNAALPFIMKFVTWTVEVHTCVASLQGSMMIKLVLARSINSAILLYIASPYNEIFDSTTLSQVMIILLVDAFITPAIRALDIPSRIMRKFVAPRQTTQAGINRFFLGTDWNMSERYTDMLKTMFVCLFYSAILPTGLIPTVISMITTYWVDKYCLFRVWKKAPAFDATLAGHSRMYMVLIVWVHVMITRVFYANWPYENRAERSVCNFVFCSEPEVGKWTSDQKLLVTIYSYLGLFLFMVGVMNIGIHYLQQYTRYRTVCGYSSGRSESGKGAAMPASYRNVSGIDCYVPMMKSPWLVEPVFGIDLTRLSLNAQQFLPVRSGANYTAEELSMNNPRNFPSLSTKDRAQLFSRIKYYPAPGEELVEAGPGYNDDTNLDTGDAGGLPAVFKLQTFEEFSENHNALVHQNKHAFDQPPKVASTYHTGIMIPVNGKMITINGDTRMPTNTAEEYESMKNSQTAVPPNPNDPLPEGWSERVTADGRTFYANDEKQFTQWERPTAPAAIASTPQPVKKNDDEVDWYVENIHYETKVDPDGNVYYEDHVKRITTWERPYGPIHL